MPVETRSQQLNSALPIVGSMSQTHPLACTSSGNLSISHTLLSPLHCEATGLAAPNGWYGDITQPGHTSLNDSSWSPTQLEGRQRTHVHDAERPTTSLWVPVRPRLSRSTSTTAVMVSFLLALERAVCVRNVCSICPGPPAGASGGGGGGGDGGGTFPAFGRLGGNGARSCAMSEMFRRRTVEEWQRLRSPGRDALRQNRLRT
jgi:hypothetical protein